MLVEESCFSSIPSSSRVRLRFVSFSKLEAGDYVLVTTPSGPSVRRFLSVTLHEGCTRLRVVDGEGKRENLAFTKLLGRIDEVLRESESYSPNPTNFFQRVAFRLSHSFSGRNSAA